MSVKILSTVETSCTTNPQQIEVRSERVTVDRPVVNSHDSLTYRCRQQTRPSTKTSFVENAIDLPWRNFLSPEFVTKF